MKNLLLFSESSMGNIALNDCPPPQLAKMEKKTGNILIIIP